MAGGLDPAHVSEVLTMRQKHVGGVDAECIAEHSGFTKLVFELISHDVSVVSYNLERLGAYHLLNAVLYLVDNLLDGEACAKAVGVELDFSRVSLSCLG